MAEQYLTSKFYKTLRIDNPKSSYGTFQDVYLFKVYDSLSPNGASWMSAYRQKDGTDFIAESGAGIPEKKMEAQLVSYLKKKIKSQGYI